jgi:hypothetical protein
VKEGGDWTQLLPPGVAGPGEACAAVRGGIPLDDTWWAVHKKMWNGLRDEFGMKDLEPVQQFPDGPGEFILSSGSWGNGTVSANVRLYTARAGKSLVAVLWTGQNYGTWSLNTWPLQRMLQGAVVKGATRESPKITEAWQRVGVRSEHYGDGTSASSATLERIVLFEGGVADFSLKHDEGYDAFPIWKVDVDASDNAFGRWKVVGDELHITRGGTTQVHKRADGKLHGGGDAWTPMLRVDGLRLTGRFGRKSGERDPIRFHEWIEFSADGKFSMANILQEKIVDGQRQKPPEQGSGTYEIRNWTLHLKLDSGYAQSQDFMIFEGDVKNPDSIRLRTVMYKREK